ncbi:MAG: PA2778 family cysteine peptidase, partial [Gammaproteobacteria bacterium]
MSVAALALLTGCAAGLVVDRDRPAIELSEVPFFPQNRYQCGPAALATVLVASGVDITPDRLVPEVYLPSRRGSLQIELQAAARRHGRLPYELAPDLEVLLDTVTTGMPVLVLQNLGFSWLPRWHYGVVVGYDPGRSAVLLRSGRERRRAEPVGRFQRTWSLAGRWAVVALRPGEIQATASPSTDLETVVAAGAALAPDSI